MLGPLHIYISYPTWFLKDRFFFFYCFIFYRQKVKRNRVKGQDITISEWEDQYQSKLSDAIAQTLSLLYSHPTLIYFWELIS